MRRMQSVSLSREMERALVALGADVDRMRIERRAAQVRAMWADIVDEPIVRHTNAVYIRRTDAGKELIAYVDESMYAAELNARRELIKLQFLRRYGEEIGAFKIAYLTRQVQAQLSVCAAERGGLRRGVHSSTVAG